MTHLVDKEMKVDIDLFTAHNIISLHWLCSLITYCPIILHRETQRSIPVWFGGLIEHNSSLSSNSRVPLWCLRRVIYSYSFYWLKVWLQTDNWRRQKALLITWGNVIKKFKKGQKIWSGRWFSATESGMKWCLSPSTVLNGGVQRAVTHWISFFLYDACRYNRLWPLLGNVEWMTCGGNVCGTPYIRQIWQMKKATGNHTRYHYNNCGAASL